MILFDRNFEDPDQVQISSSHTTGCCEILLC